jgi:hypothetical protein
MPTLVRSACAVFRKLLLLFGGGSTLLIVTSASAESVTTRIETNDEYGYGATVTREHGVRVIRPLPPGQVISAPDVGYRLARPRARGPNRAVHGGGMEYGAWGRRFLKDKQEQ